ncbi:hypothetical protein [Flavobacterium panacagri]|uniref:hypothetical protein n=1 Tax=Flavobacterium panacagri TaxID=3034146 RepID=UPI0025A5B372|nr:hypothetical protein [Flavobacterium panacagri]
MKKISLLICFVFGFNLWSQNLCRTEILPKEELFPKNEMNKYLKYNFSDLWNKTDNNLVYGVIGDNYERILIKIVSIQKSKEKSSEYWVVGTSRVKSNSCNFKGKITIISINELKQAKLGVDDEYKNAGIKKQGLLKAVYEFVEDSKQKGSGKFSGILESMWYLDKNNLIQYNDIEIDSDKYFNNAFTGVWKSNNSGKEKICNWGDYRVPNVNCDFDIGSAEISVSQKYQKNGWK